MTTVRELMTAAPYTVNHNETIGPIRDAILDSGFHCLPVLDGDGVPVGIVSSWDLVEEYAPQESVRNAMTTGVLTIGANDDIEVAAKTMTTNFVNHLVVVEEERVVGVISSLDLVSALIDA